MPQLKKDWIRHDRESVRSPREDDAALLTVATTFTFANTWLAWRLGAFQVEHPGLAVRLRTENRLVDFKAGEADVAIRGAPSRPRGLG